MREIGNAYRILIEKCEGIRPFRRLGHTGDDNIKICYKETAAENVGMTRLSCEHGDEP
jgi:hypothetical protein